MISIDLSAETEINAAPADIAAVMFDPQREPEWMSTVKAVDIIDPALQPGARVKRTASFFGQPFSWTTQVESVHFPHILTLRITDGPFSGVISYNIQRSERGSTVRIRNKGETSKLGFLPASVVEGPMQTAMEQDLRRLKALIENGNK